ncbi:Ppx/GppA phosphatase family protein [Mesorhizobium humile]|uniref:Ppx/GppA phosphatase family protein n=1 Tax=Mesorhizobium humile TaxID=3072313 RepID=A0ABU4YI89_9HYPH|nr:MULTISPECIES: Ppx/GppA phosphatase family protein [unclassified Mesorhizobium]MDX8461849.1 Ppx/GppA phosphatase family protein [Mesorhizobium sp. VK2D]MDX8486603.1 Ppx/GppA phosphatase family protein [Mesorhizobium sp. VK2B]
MEDHDTGAGASAVGMSGASPTQSAGPQPARFSRHAGAHQRHADPRHANQRQTGASLADQQGDPPKGKTRKRRKRRRGRKVFARDDNGAPPPAAPAAIPASQAQSAPSQVEPRPPQSPPRPPQQELPVFAALDLGTNNCRLLVAVPGRHGQFRVIDAFSRIVRLGEGLTASGRLSQAAMDRAVEALKICGDKLRNRKIRKARLIATEACRSAANGVEFLDRVEREAGLKLEIIDRQTEARLAVSGCGSLVERDTQGVVLFDIGGGSSEIALIDLTGRRSPRLANHIVSWTSLPVGVVSLAERFGGRTVTRETFAAMVDDVAARLKVFDGRDRLAHVLASPNFHLLGTSGTVTTLAGVHLDLERYDRRRVDGLWMDRDSVDRMIERLIGWDFQQRCANPCIGADRADLVLAGCAILEAIRGVWPSERLRVADRGLREGILSELMADDGVWRGGRP